MVPPIASVCLYPPTCVGFGTGAPPRSGFFQGAWLRSFAMRLRPRLGLICRADLPALRPGMLHGGVQNPACVPSPSPFGHRRSRRRYRNVRLLRIGHAFRPRLSSRLTLGRISLPRKPGLRRRRFAPLTVTHASILTPLRPPSVALRLRRAGSSPSMFFIHSAAFGASLSPVNCRRMSTDQ